MAVKVIMPKQGLQMTEGTVTKWLVSEGDHITVGMPVFEMETDKTAITIDSKDEGVLLKIIKAAGETVPIAETVAIIGAAGEDYSDLLAEALHEGSDGKILMTESSDEADLEIEGLKNSENKKHSDRQHEESTDIQCEESGRIFISPRAKMKAEKNDVDYTEIPGTGPDGMVIERDILKSTPVARKLARMEGISLGGIMGSGARGKIMKSDVAAAENNMAAVAEKNETPIPITGMRKAICETMMRSLHHMAQANHKIRVDMTQGALIRQAFKDEQKKISYNDIIVMAAAKALVEYPYMNAVSDQNNYILKNEVNIGIAVAVDNGLIVPTLRNADKMTLSEIHENSKDLINAVQEGGLSPDMYSGGTFTVTNLGMYDIDEFVAIINPPQVGILAVGKIGDDVVARNGQAVIRPLMTLTLTYDHRIIDGAPAARFLQRIKELLENPYKLF